MPQSTSRKLNVIAAGVVIGLVGAAVGAWRYQARNFELRRELLGDVQRSAVAFDRAELKNLTGSAADVSSPTYAAVRERLRKLETIDSRARAVYLLRVPPAPGKVVVLAASVSSNAGKAPAPGDNYPPAAQSSGLQEIVRAGQPATDGPLADALGTSLMAYARIGGESAPTTGQESEILALNVDATHWRRGVWQSAFQGALSIWLALGLPLIAWFVARRQLQQRHVIRNLSEAMEQSHSAIVIIGLDGRIEFANRGLCEQTGYARGEVIGRTWRDFRVTETSNDVLMDLLATVRAGRSWEGEWFNRRQNGTIYPARGVVTPVRHRDGSLACFVAVFDDATEAKEREAELREARDLAQAGDRAKGHFLATMSHEVRTPLNGIVGFTSLLLDTPLTPEQREYVQTIRLSTEALIQLTGDILDFARIESGKLKLDPLACDPRECVEDTLDVLAPKADAKKIELLHRVDNDVPAAVVTDGGRLRQILANLVGNAIKFTERGEVEVRVRRLPTAAQPALVGTAHESCVLEFAVRDTGIGIAPQHHAKLFRAFSQVDESTTRRYSGTGLGLAICRELVELMGGAIGVESEAGKGATFTFTIRAAVAARVPPTRNLSGMKLGLLVEPDALRREIADLVRGWGGDVVEVASPDQLSGANTDIVLVGVDEDSARDIAAQPAPLFGVTSDKLFGLVPISLGSELRTVLRGHFRLLVNKPVHHDSFYALLAGSVGNAPAPPPPPHFGFRVLVVDDNHVNQRLVQRVLTTLGCVPTPVENGREAVELLRQRAAEFDVVLLDLHMPEMDGFEALHEIRGGNAGPQAQTIWVIALTADAREEQRVLANSEGLNDYLTKPLKPADLELALRKFRSQRAARKR